jgi:hypothetical protein
MKKAIGFCLLLFVLEGPAWSQTGAGERINANAKGSTFTGLSAAEDALLEEDSGEIIISTVAAKTAPKPKYFSVSFVNLIEYNSNALLSNVDQEGDVLFMPSLDFGYYRPLGAGFSVIAGANVNTTFYADFDENSYWGASGRVGADYRYNQVLPRVYAIFNPYYYQSYDTGDHLTEALAFSLGADNQHVFNQDRTAFFYGFDYSRFYTDPSFDDRESARATVGLTHSVFKHAFLQPFYTFQYSNYFNQPREDFRHAVGLAFIYDFTPWLSVRVYGNYAKNYSSLDSADYENFASGAGSGITVRF